MRQGLKHPVAIMGLPIDSLTEDEAVDALEQLILSGGTHQVCTTNVDIWLNALADAHLHRIVAGASLVLADGMPLVWISKWLGCPLPARVTGVDLVPRLAELSARKGYGIFLLGAGPGVAERTARLLESKFPGVRIVGTCAPDAASLSQIERSGILQMIHQARPDVLLVALGNPKQEKWTWTHRKQLQVPVAIGVGGSFDILVGDMQRAPRWLQQCGLEWAMRTVQEPLRLIPRYVRDLFGLARSVPLAVLAAWLQRPYRGPSQVTMAAAPKLLHVHVQGGLCAERAEAMAEATKSCIENGLTMVVHLEAARQTTVAGFGVLLDARRELLEAGLSLALAGLRWKTRFALYAWRLRALFDEWQPAVSRGHSLSVERPANLATGGEQARTRFHSEQEKPAA